MHTSTGQAICGQALYQLGHSSETTVQDRFVAIDYTAGMELVNIMHQNFRVLEPKLTNFMYN